MKQYHLFILDGSGSMEDLKDLAINSVNEYITMIKKTAEEEEIDLYFSLLLFSDKESGENINRYVYKEEKIKNVKKFRKKDYLPYSLTPLFDVVGKGISDLREIEDLRLSPYSKAFITIFTDGFENSSVEYNKGSIRQIINNLDKNKFDINFIGCGSFDQIQEYASSFGIMSSNISNYVNEDDYIETMNTHSTNIVKKMKNI